MKLRILVALLCMTATISLTNAQNFEIKGAETICFDESQSYEALPTNGLSFPTGHVVVWDALPVGLCDGQIAGNTIIIQGCASGGYVLSGINPAAISADLSSI